MLAAVLWAARFSLQSYVENEKLPDHAVCNVIQACIYSAPGVKQCNFCFIPQCRLMPRHQLSMLSAGTINLCDVQKLIVQGAANEVATVSDYYNPLFPRFFHKNLC